MPSPKKKTIFILAAVLLLTGAAAWFGRGYLFQPKSQAVVLYGNVDDRQVDLAFIVSERIAAIDVEEGDAVRKGQLVATLEDVRIKQLIELSKAAVEAASQNFQKAQNGPRKEDIEIARAGVTAAQAALDTSWKDYVRQRDLAETKSVSEKIAENAEMKYLVSKSGLRAAQQYLDQLLAGTRAEDVAAAKATLEQQKAQLAIYQQQLIDCRLLSPTDGIVRNRLLEPGEMASPQRAALKIAVTDPKWVRVYFPEPLLPKIKSGDAAKVTADGLGEAFDGWVGFIAPNAEFTPKTVETLELRPALVYEVRVFIKDPARKLKLGAPVTVTFPHLGMPQ